MASGILKLISRDMEAFSLVINGESRSFPAPLTVSGLIETLGYTGKRVAIERNGEIVPRSQHGQVALKNGDKLEIVVAVGGG
jgi:sulfur carrier protein